MAGNLFPAMAPFLLMRGDSRVLAGLPDSELLVAAASVRENKFPTSQKKILGI